MQELRVQSDISDWSLNFLKGTLCEIRVILCCLECISASTTERYKSVIQSVDGASWLTC